MGRQEHTTQKWARDTLEMRRVKTERNHKSNTLTEKTLPARILETNVSSDFCHVYSVIASFFLSHDIHIYHHMTSTYIITTYVHRYHHVWSCVRMGEMFVTCRVWKKNAQDVLLGNCRESLNHHQGIIKCRSRQKKWGGSVRSTAWLSSRGSCCLDMLSLVCDACMGFQCLETQPVNTRNHTERGENFGAAHPQLKRSGIVEECQLLFVYYVAWPH